MCGGTGRPLAASDSAWRSWTASDCAAAAQGSAGSKETVHARDKGMAHRGDTPRDDRDTVADLFPELVDKPSEEQQTYGVCTLEGRIDHPELFVAPSQLVVQHWLDKRKDLTIDVIDRGGDE